MSWTLGQSPTFIYTGNNSHGLTEDRWDDDGKSSENERKLQRCKATVYLSESETETPRWKHCLNLMAGCQTYVLKMEQMERAAIIQTQFDWILLIMAQFRINNKPESGIASESISSNDGKMIYDQNILIKIITHDSKYHNACWALLNIHTIWNPPGSDKYLPFCFLTVLSHRVHSVVLRHFKNRWSPKHSGAAEVCLCLCCLHVTPLWSLQHWAQV